jgi:PASTA domain
VGLGRQRPWRDRDGTDGIPQLTPVQLALSGAIVVAESAGDSAAILPGGKLMLWGSNQDLDLGTGTSFADQVIPAQNPELTGVTQIALGPGAALAVGYSTAVAVPEIRGDDLSTATTALRAAGLALGTVSDTGVCSSAGHVLTQNPAAGTQTRPGSAVSVTIGKLKLCP